MKSNVLLDTLDEALEHMAHGMDAELCASRCSARGESLRPLLQVARELFELADQTVKFTPRADALDWATLLANAPQCPTLRSSGDRASLLQ